MFEIENKAVRPADQTHRKIVLAFNPERGTFTGQSGCNTLAGRFETTGGKLTLRPDQPLQICRVDQRTERALRGVFNDTRSYRVAGRTLELFDEQGKRIARLERD